MAAPSESKSSEDKTAVSLTYKHNAAQFPRGPVLENICELSD